MVHWTTPCAPSLRDRAAPIGVRLFGEASKNCRATATHVCKYGAHRLEKFQGLRHFWNPLGHSFSEIVVQSA